MAEAGLVKKGAHYFKKRKMNWSDFLRMNISFKLIRVKRVKEAKRMIIPKKFAIEKTSAAAIYPYTGTNK